MNTYVRLLQVMRHYHKDSCTCEVLGENTLPSGAASHVCVGVDHKVGKLYFLKTT